MLVALSLPTLPSTSELPTSLSGFGINSVLDGMTTWVSDGAVWLLGQIGTVLQDTTQIDLSASWFTTHFATMADLAGVVIVPMLLLGIIQAIHRQSTSMLLRSILINVPVALVLTGVAVQLVQLGLALTDAMSSEVASGAGLNTGQFLSSTVAALSGTAVTDPTAPAFLVFVGGLVVVFGAFLLWAELLVRTAAVYVAVLFLPLALASLTWPAISHWCRRLVEVLVALILSKFVIVTVLSLGVGAVAGGSGSQSTANDGGFSSVLGGAALLFLAALSPWALLRLLPLVESTAIGHLEGVGRRGAQSVMGPTKSLATAALGATGAGELALMGGSLGKLSQGGSGGGSVSSGGSRSGSALASASSGTSGSGVGEELEAGANVPFFGTSVPATEAFHASSSASGGDSVEGVSGVHDGASSGPGTGSVPFTPSGGALPMASGSRRLHVLGHDDLGPRLQRQGAPSGGGTGRSGSPGSGDGRSGSPGNGDGRYGL